jgi:hypothetical protein
MQRSKPCDTPLRTDAQSVTVPLIRTRGCPPTKKSLIHMEYVSLSYQGLHFAQQPLMRNTIKCFSKIEVQFVHWRPFVQQASPIVQRRQVVSSAVSYGNKALLTV